MMKAMAHKLPQFTTPFVRLPFKLDMKQLQNEVGNVMGMNWLAHPQGFAGNQTLPLVSVNGQYNHDFAISGQMLPTPALHKCPYIQQILAGLQVPVSRSRLMLLAPGAEVSRHFDAGYHWYRRVRIHIPILTDPKVIFGCADQEIHMREGEAWCFDHSKWHWVKNNSSLPRVHLVIDTKGSPDFFSYFSCQKECIDHKLLNSEKAKTFQLEPYRFEVLEPQEMAELLSRIIAQFEKSNELQVIEKLRSIAGKWQNVFIRYGHSSEGEASYDELIKILQGGVDVEKLNHQALSAYSTITTMLNRNNGEPITVKSQD